MHNRIGGGSAIQNYTQYITSWIRMYCVSFGRSLILLALAVTPRMPVVDLADK